MYISNQKNIKSNSTIGDLQNQLDRVQDQILHCVAEAKHYTKYIELLDKKVHQLAIKEEELVRLLKKLSSYRFCQV